MKKLNEIVDYEFSKERTEKSKYFTEKFFEENLNKYVEIERKKIILKKKRKWFWIKYVMMIEKS